MKRCELKELLVVGWVRCRRLDVRPPARRGDVGRYGGGRRRRREETTRFCFVLAADRTVEMAPHDHTPPPFKAGSGSG